MSRTATISAATLFALVIAVQPTVLAAPGSDEVEKSVAKECTDIQNHNKNARASIPTNRTIKGFEDKLDVAARAVDDAKAAGQDTTNLESMYQTAQANADTARMTGSADNQALGEKYRDALKNRREARGRLQKVCSNITDSLLRGVEGPTWKRLKARCAACLDQTVAVLNGPAGTGAAPATVRNATPAPVRAAAPGPAQETDQGPAINPPYESINRDRPPQGGYDPPVPGYGAPPSVPGAVIPGPGPGGPPR